MSDEPMIHVCDEIRQMWTPAYVARYMTGWTIEMDTVDPMGESSVTMRVHNVRYCPWCGQELPTEEGA